MWYFLQYSEQKLCALCVEDKFAMNKAQMRVHLSQMEKAGGFWEKHPMFLACQACSRGCLKLHFNT